MFFDCRRLVIRQFNVGFAGFQKCSQGREHFSGDNVFLQFKKQCECENVFLQSKPFSRSILGRAGVSLILLLFQDSGAVGREI